MTLCYADNIRDFGASKSDLKIFFWLIDCNYELYQKDNFGPKGALRDRVLALRDLEL